MTSISAYGSTQSLYFKQESGTTYYSNNNSSWTPVTWPISIANLDSASSALLQIFFTTNFTLTNANQYFTPLTSFIQFGSTSLNSDGTQAKFTVVDVLNYPGLVKNGESGSNGIDAISVVNIGVESSGTTTLQDDGGWICQSYFGRGVSCRVIACYSTGEISSGSGGIVGAFSGSSSGTLNIEGCYSRGGVLALAGGIAGKNCGDSGTINITACGSTGAIYGFYGGGICGRYAGNDGSVTCSSCYSSGRISGDYAGGICGSQAGNGTGIARIVQCYSRGDIEGINTGGICGQDFGVSSNVCTIEKCYSTGTIMNFAGGILSTSTAGVIAILSCYTTGFIADSLGRGGIQAGTTTIPSGCRAEGDGTWRDIYAYTILGTSGWIQPITVNTPFFLENFSYSPYSLNNITDASGNPFNVEESATVEVGQSTSGILATGYLSYLVTQNADIYITPSTGVISTTNTISPGVYTLTIFVYLDPAVPNAVPPAYYATVTYTLTVVAPPAAASQADGNRQINNFINVSSEYRYNLLSGQYMSTNASYVNVRQFGSYADYLRYRLANGF